jgi:copper chaperone CopZ
MKKTSFNIEGINGVSGEGHIKNSLCALTGVNNVEIALGEHRVDVEYDADLLSELQLRQTIEHKGYDVRDNPIR